MMDTNRFTHVPPHTVGITGSTGLVGSALVPFLQTQGHVPVRFVRSEPVHNGNVEQRHWNPANSELSSSQLEGLDAVVHLAGKNIAASRWTASVKKELWDSRVKSTALLASKMAQMKSPPKVLVCASAIGFYGSGLPTPATEQTPRGDGFLAELTEAWEKACQPAVDAGVRVVHLRISMVLARQGGALAKMRTPFALGLGGVLGHGRQQMSWVSLDDLLDMVAWCVFDERIFGPMNAVSPHPVSNREFTRTLGRVLSRPTPIAAPAAVLRAVFGRELADQALLADLSAAPQVLQNLGFEWRHPDLESALRHALSR